MKHVNTSIRKKDYKSLVTGKPVYTDDIAPKHALVVKLIRSPHANAIVRNVKTDIAKKLPGIACVLTHSDVPKKRFTIAGQTYPEMSPYDRYILDEHVRYVGEPVVIVAGDSEEVVDKAIKTIQIEYEVLDALMDMRDAMTSSIKIHDEEDWFAHIPTGGNPEKNLVSSATQVHGDMDDAWKHCDYIVEETYHSLANQQTMMETFQTFTSIDEFGRLNVVSSTQIPFHVRRILSNALGIPKSDIRVSKPRMGGGFGAKQSSVSEVYPALVTHITGKCAKIVFTREESLIASSPRHEMEIKVKIGASKDGSIQAIDMYALSNNGAYGDHGPTTVGLVATKNISLYPNVKAFKFAYDVVYTNRMAAGAYRGYGATQGCYALESAVNELAHKMDIDPSILREKNMVKESDVLPLFNNDKIRSCSLDRCVATAKKMSDWDNTWKAVDVGNGKVRAKGMAITMQGSGIGNIDVASASIKMNDDGFVTLHVGSTDMGTGSDTTLAQVAAEALDLSIDKIKVISADTDASPYDTGSYASSTAYVTGMAVYKASEEMLELLYETAAKLLNCTTDELSFEDEIFTSGDKELSLSDLVTFVQQGKVNVSLQTSYSHKSPVSPPPFMVGIASVEVDKYTGKVSLLDYVGVVDCGVALNPNICRVQAEGGIVQGIGMALFENIQYNSKNAVINNSLMQYNIPNRQDIGTIRVEFEESYESTGPFGAKSIGEVVINTPAPAIADAIYNAVGVRLRKLPMLAQDVFEQMK